MVFNAQPALVGSRVLLRPMEENDFEALYDVAKDPQIWDQIDQPNRHLRDVYLKNFENALASGGALVALDLRTNQIVGASRFYDFDEQKKQVAIGYTFLARSLWGSGFNSEMKRLMLNHAFLHVERVIFHIATKNVRSQKAIEKIGARLAGEENRKFFGHQQAATFLVYELVRPGSTHE